ncbi:MAG: FeS cluster assembly protein SufD [Gemmatimonadaceae bacterium]|nr:FeS cluster assembly protein SufD [Gemmatimonadaceae bacterium]
MNTAFLEHFAALPQEGPSFLAAMRRDALARFTAHGFPTPRNEDWHFTSPAPIVESSFEPMRPMAAPIDRSAIAPWMAGSDEWPLLVFVNGRFAPSLSSTASLPVGVRAMSLASALLEEPTLVERYLGRVASFNEQAFAFVALNTALMRDGSVIHVARDTRVSRPLHMLFLTDDAADGGVTHPRNLVVVDRNAEVSLIEQYASLAGGRSLTNAVTEAVLDDGATLRHYRLQRENMRAFHTGHVDARLARDAHYHSFSFATGAELSRINIYATLGGEGSGATLNGLYMLDDVQHCDHQTRIEHARPNCYSRELYKGILDGASHGVFNGKVYVHAEAQKTDGKQTNNTLLLSERARIDTKPQLEIFADDVKCTHGATVGRLDALSAFYMRSRGITAATTRRLLTYAFAAEVLETIELEPLRTALEALTLARYAGE